MSVDQDGQIVVMGVIQHLGTINATEQPKAMVAKPENRNKLCYVEAQLSGKYTVAMVDTRATHNFISAGRARDLGLKVQADACSFKAVNSPFKKIHGIIWDIPLKVGSWQGRMDLRVIEMDDFELILGQEFLKIGKVAVIPHLDLLVFLDPKQTCLVKMTERRQSRKAPMISALGMKKAAKKHGKEPMFLAVLLGGWDELEDVQETPIPPKVEEVILEFEDTMPVKLPAQLLERRTVDHKIELVPGMKPPA